MKKLTIPTMILATFLFSCAGEIDTEDVHTTGTGGVLDIIEAVEALEEIDDTSEVKAEDVETEVGEAE